MTMRGLVAGVLLWMLGAVAACAADLKAPPNLVAGSDFSISASSGNGGTFYLIGPSQISKREWQGGPDINVAGDEVLSSGTYTAVLCSGGDCTAVTFYVKPASAARLSLLVHPSRVRVAEPNAISAVALVFDKFHNLLTEPASVEFQAFAADGQPISQSRPAANGIAWIRLTSGRKEGPVKMSASTGPAKETRVVRQVASD